MAESKTLPGKLLAEQLRGLAADPHARAVLAKTFRGAPMANAAEALHALADGIEAGTVLRPRAAEETGEVAPLGECEAQAFRVARRRLRLLHTSLAGRRQDWANNVAAPCSSARAVAYQSAMQSVRSIIDEIEAIAGGPR